MNEKTYHLINDFLEGKLQGRQLDEFKAMMKDPEFAKQVDIQEQIAEAIKAQRKAELKAMLAQDDGPAYIQNMWGNRWTYASAAIVILFVSAFFLMKRFAPDMDTQEAYTEEAEPMIEVPQDTLVPADSGMLAVEEAVPSPSAEITEVEDDVEEQPITVVDRETLVMADQAPSMLKSTEVAEPEEEVMTENLLQISNYRVVVLSPDFGRAEAASDEADSAGEAVAKRSPVGSKDLQVEFWTNPINYKGYRYTDGKLKLYQAQDAGPISFKELDDRLYLQMSGNYYFIAKDGMDHKFVPVTNETLLGVLNE